MAVVAARGLGGQPHGVPPRHGVGFGGAALEEVADFELGPVHPQAIPDACDLVHQVDDSCVAAYEQHLPGVPEGFGDPSGPDVGCPPWFRRHGGLDHIDEEPGWRGRPLARGDQGQQRRPGRTRRRRLAVGVIASLALGCPRGADRRR